MKVITLLIGSALTFAIVVTSSQAHAQDEPAEKFGVAGQLAISSDIGASVEHQFQGRGSTTVVLHPAADYFLIDHLSLGGYVHLGVQSGGGTAVTSFGVGPRIGVNIDLSSRFSFWPKAGVAFNHTSVSPPAPAPSQ